VAGNLKFRYVSVIGHFGRRKNNYTPQFPDLAQLIREYDVAILYSDCYAEWSLMPIDV